MNFTCTKKECLSTITDRVFCENETVHLTFDVHKEFFDVQERDLIQVSFDESLGYASNVTIINATPDGILGSIGGLLFLWEGGHSITENGQFIFSTGKVVSDTHIEPSAGARKSKRIKAH